MRMFVISGVALSEVLLPIFVSTLSVNSTQIKQHPWCIKGMFANICALLSMHRTRWEDNVFSLKYNFLIRTNTAKHNSRNFSYDGKTLSFISIPQATDQLIYLIGLYTVADTLNSCSVLMDTLILYTSTCILHNSCSHTWSLVGLSPTNASIDVTWCHQPEYNS